MNQIGPKGEKLCTRQEISDGRTDERKDKWMDWQTYHYRAPAERGPNNKTVIHWLYRRTLFTWRMHFVSNFIIYKSDLQDPLPDFLYAQWNRLMMTFSENGNKNSCVSTFKNCYIYTNINAWDSWMENPRKVKVMEEYGRINY